MSGTQDARAKLYDVETRIPKRTLDSFKRLAAANHRSVAAEMRVALERHLAENLNGEKAA